MADNGKQVLSHPTQTPAQEPLRIIDNQMDAAKRSRVAKAFNSVRLSTNKTTTLNTTASVTALSRNNHDCEKGAPQE